MRTTRQTRRPSPSRTSRRTTPPPDPAWQGQFRFSVEYDPDGSDSVDIYQAYMAPLEDWDGDPWGSASLWPASWGWSDSYEMKYTLTISKGSTEYTSTGTFDVYQSEDFQETGHRSKMFFFWEEQTGSWAYRLTCRCEGKTDVSTGYFDIRAGGRVVQ